jgi:DNA mismatch repair protein MutS2
VLRRLDDAALETLLARAEGEAGRALPVDEAARAARQSAERLAAEQGAALDRLDGLERRDAARAGAENAHDAPNGAIDVGSAVEVGTLGGRVGRVVELRDGSAVVAVGGMKLTVPTATLRPSARAEPAERAVAVVGDLPDVQAPSEIDLRGMRADEIEPILMQALDAAVRADLRSLRVIHGKGTGALRDRVSEMLRKESRVKGFRLGAWNEGGSGVTVVEL